MSRRLVVVSLSIVAGAVALGAVAASVSARDPMGDFAAMRERAAAGPRASMPVAVRGVVVAVRPGNLLQIRSDGLFPQRLWVLSRSAVEVEVGARVAAQGILHARGLAGVDTGAVPDEIEGDLCRRGVLVADALTIYRGGMHG